MSVAETLIEKIKGLSSNEQELLLKYIEQLPKKKRTAYEQFEDFIKEMDSRPSQLPADYSINHDHYLHGMPKRS